MPIAKVFDPETGETKQITLAADRTTPEESMRNAWEALLANRKKRADNVQLASKQEEAAQKKAEEARKAEEAKAAKASQTNAPQ